MNYFHFVTVFVMICVIRKELMAYCIASKYVGVRNVTLCTAQYLRKILSAAGCNSYLLLTSTDVCVCGGQQHE